MTDLRPETAPLPVDQGGRSATGGAAAPTHAAAL